MALQCLALRVGCVRRCHLVEFDVLESLDRGSQTESALITGPTGSGKTCIATFPLDEFRQDQPTIDPAYVNCWGDHSRFQIHYRILDQLWSTGDIHRRSRRGMSSSNSESTLKPLVVAFEKVRLLLRDEDQRELRKGEEFVDEALVVELIGLIENDNARVVVEVPEPVCKRIRCTPYSGDQLLDILTTWSKHELEAITIDSSKLSRIAVAAGGDARVALTTLQIAARRTDQASNERIRYSIR